MDLVFANMRLHDYFHLRNQPTIQDRCCTYENVSWPIFEGVRVRSARCTHDSTRVRTGRLHSDTNDKVREKHCYWNLRLS